MLSLSLSPHHPIRDMWPCGLLRRKMRTKSYPPGTGKNLVDGAFRTVHPKEAIERFCSSVCEALRRQ